MNKYVHQLVNADLETHDIWEYIKSDDIEDGLLIRPLEICKNNFKGRLKSAAIFETFFVKVDFITSNDRTFSGFCKVTNHTSKFILQAFEPVILHEDRHIPLWYGMHLPDTKMIEDFYLHLRINPENLFPLTMFIIPDVFHIDNNGIIDGFYGLDDSMQLKRIEL